MSTTINTPRGSELPGDDLPIRRASLHPSPVWQVLKVIASLRLTVALFALSMVLVFFGTLAQIDRSVFSVVDEYFRSWVVWVPLQLSAEFAKKFFDLDETAVWPGAFPVPGGWALGFAMLFNLIAAHLTRMKLSWRRTGVIVLHLGVIILMVGELITGVFAIESRMMLQVGESRNFIDAARHFELAVTNPATHQTVTIPQGMLTPGTIITHPELPFDVKVLKRYKNTTLRPATGGDDTDKLVSVVGGRYTVQPAAEANGVSADQPEDVPGVEVQLLKKLSGEVIRERLYTLWDYENGPGSRQYMSLPSEVTVDSNSYRVQLRNQRIYKPYTLTLLNFEHKTYAGTDMAKDFASTARLQDPETGEDRVVRIWMNHPLRHRGETLYQASFVPSVDGKDTGTVLQVVKNPGWLLPYVSCVVVTLGMLIHFGMTLARFLDKLHMRPASTGRRDAPAQPIPTPNPQSRNWPATVQKYFPWAVIGVCAVYALSLLAPRKDRDQEFDLSAFGAIPVLDDGRIKPLDTLARTKLLFISGRSDYEAFDKNRENKRTRPAIQWLLETLSMDDPNSGPANNLEIFRIDNEQLLQFLELKYKPGSYRYSFNELQPRYEAFKKVVDDSRKMDANKRDLFNAKAIELAQRISVYLEFAHHMTPTVIPRVRGSDTWLSLGEIDRQVAQPFAEEAMEKAEDEVRQKWLPMLKQILALPESEQRSFQLRMQRDVMDLAQRNLVAYAEANRGSISPPAAAFGDILIAYRKNEPKRYQEAINTYVAEHVYPLNQEFSDTVRFEQAMNQANPLIAAAFLFIFSGVFRVIGWLVWERAMRQTAWGVALIGLALLVTTLLGRMYIMQRPLVFVTNLYSSALMIGAGALTFCLIFEKVFKNGIALAVGVAAAASAVDIAHHLSTDGKDTMGALVAVLDTNYWLASHVTTITLGYAATYVAGAMGATYIAWGLFLPNFSSDQQKRMTGMIYGVLCFAMFFSFVGTVLGGIWADQSWGRFWGWDPKENGAVLIVIWNALILHARWCGLAKQRGVAVLAVAGTMITTWSYFGTNQLGAGLHNYGFNKTLADGCANAWVTALVIIGVGLIPSKYWRCNAVAANPPRATLVTKPN